MKRILKTVVFLSVLASVALSAGAAEMKTVIILTYPGDTAEHCIFMAKSAINALAQAGFVDQQNVTIEVWKDQYANVEDEAAALEQRSPSVVIDCSSRPQQIAQLLAGKAIPVIATYGIEAYVTDKGRPTTNITGVYTFYPDMAYNSFKFLRTVSPLKPGQQAVLFENTQFNLLPQQMVRDALTRLNIRLKAVVDTSVIDDFQAAVEQYNADPDVGWMLMGVWPTVKRDGSPVNMELEIVDWHRTHVKKPMVTYWESAVMQGILCGLAVDLNEAGAQSGEMAARVLKGEDITTINAQYPRKTLVALNRKTADFMGIVFPPDVLNLANVIYHDWEGKNVSRKSGLK